MAIRLPDSIYSQNQVGVALAELHTYAGHLRDSLARAKIESQPIDIAPSPFLDALFTATNSDKKVLSGVETLITELEDLRRTAPTVHITLAAFPDESMKMTITKWFRQIHPEVFVAFGTRSDIVGGMILRTSSTIHDFSYRTQLLSHRNRISEILRSAK